MRFRTAEEFRARTKSLGVRLIADRLAHDDGHDAQSVKFWVDDARYAEVALARKFVSWLGEFTDCEFLIAEFGIWPSREDWNLYERLRISYGDDRTLPDAPSHLFSVDESLDLTTLIGIVLQFGWGGHIVPSSGDAYIFISHDGWIFASSRKINLKVTEDLDDMEIDYESHGQLF